ncbi:MAG: DUF4215 domain-containing protein [Myxococcota bacterium]|nr:DUF4215 domain-containing protein [Myxococcota bacterium]
MLRSASLKNFTSAAALLVLFACGDDPKTSNEPPTMTLCGNGTVDDGELCDDGNTSSGDYCSSDCQKVIGSCGDGRVQFSVEACDDGGACGSQYCLDSCQTFMGVCGDGVKQTPEGCDDGNTDSGDGCSDLCTLEGGSWQCTGTACGPTICSM